MASSLRDWSSLRLLGLPRKPWMMLSGPFAKNRETNRLTCRSDNPKTEAASIWLSFLFATCWRIPARFTSCLFICSNSFMSANLLTAYMVRRIGHFYIAQSGHYYFAVTVGAAGLINL